LGVKSDACAADDGEKKINSHQSQSPCQSKKHHASPNLASDRKIINPLLLSFTSERVELSEELKLKTEKTKAKKSQPERLLNESIVPKPSASSAAGNLTNLAPGLGVKSDARAADDGEKKINSNQSQQSPLERQSTAPEKTRPPLLSSPFEGVELCEEFLRKSCKGSPSCSKLHHNVPFLWQFKESNCWQSFGIAENQELESAFSDPNLTQWNKLLPPAAGYPFSGRLEVHFSMEKILIRGRPAYDVRCLRTPSHVTLPAHQIAATYWQWYYVAPSVPGMLVWVMVPQALATEIELAFLRKEKRLNLHNMAPAVLANLPGMLTEYEIDFEAMTARSGEFESEMLRRPQLQNHGLPGQPALHAQKLHALESYQNLSASAVHYNRVTSSVSSAPLYGDATPELTMEPKPLLQGLIGGARSKDYCYDNCSKKQKKQCCVQ